MIKNGHITEGVLKSRFSHNEFKNEDKYYILKI